MMVGIKKKREGVGICDIPTRTNGKCDREYALWSGILRRCYCRKYHEKKPTYIGCEISEEWKFYSNFKRDIVNVFGYDNDGYQIDKDILVKGNKIYSKDTVCFVPREINMATQRSKRRFNNLPVGVCYREYRSRTLYTSYVGKFGKTHPTGVFETKEEAFLAYKKSKQDYLKELAGIFKGMIDEPVYEILINFDVNIND